MPAARIAQLFVYPIKGCRGIAVDRAVLAATGLSINGIGDREWVVVDDHDEFLSQREVPTMALIETRLSGGALHLAAPGSAPLEVSLRSQGAIRRVRVWHDEVDAMTQGDAADAWFFSVLGKPCRLMRLAPRAQRISLARFTGAIVAPYKFADAFALLVCSTASLAELNERLAASGSDRVAIERFRPNIVLDGLEAFDEDYIDELHAGDALIRVVKRCVRCTVPNVDPATAEVHLEPGATLAGYRNDAKEGGITFGVNAIVERSAGASLSVGDTLPYTLRF